MVEEVKRRTRKRLSGGGVADVDANMMCAVVVSKRANASLGFVPFFGRNFVSRSS